MFELKGRFGVARQKVVKMIRGPERENMSACSSSGASMAPQQESNVPYINHSVEAEAQKAQALVYYRRTLDTIR